MDDKDIQGLNESGHVDWLANRYFANMRDSRPSKDSTPKTQTMSIRLRCVDLDALTETAKYLRITRNTLMVDLLYYGLHDLHFNFKQELDNHGLPQDSVEELANNWVKAIEEEKQAL